MGAYALVALTKQDINVQKKRRHKGRRRYLQCKVTKALLGRYRDIPGIGKLINRPMVTYG
jgi:hypothetical protein